MRPPSPTRHLERLEGQVAVHWRCPYCHADLIDNSVASECNACHTMHHVSCFAENRGCSTHGCESHRAHSVRVGTPLRANAKVPACGHCTKALDPTALVARCACGRVNHPLCFEVIGRCTLAHCQGNADLMSYGEFLAIGKRANASALTALGWVALLSTLSLIPFGLAIGANDGVAIVFMAIGTLGAVFSAALFAARGRANAEAVALEASPPRRRTSPAPDVAELKPPYDHLLNELRAGVPVEPADAN